MDLIISNCFCETSYLHFTTRVFGHSAITSFLGGLAGQFSNLSGRLGRLCQFGRSRFIVLEAFKGLLAREMSDSRDGWMRGRSWWDERLREIRQSSQYQQRENELELKRKSRRNKRDRTKVRASKSPPPIVSVSVSSNGGRARARSSTRSLSPLDRAGSPVRSSVHERMNGWDDERVRRDSKAWKEMLDSTGKANSIDNVREATVSTHQSTPEKCAHVRAVLNKLQEGWLAVRKVLSTQARASGVEPLEDFSIGFDDFAAAIEMAGVSATRMQLAAVFTLIDAEKCEIITLGELVGYLRREGLRVSAFRSKNSTRETEKARRALADIFDHVVEVMVAWDLHGNNSTTLIDIGRGLRFLKIQGCDVNKVIAEASANCSLTDGVVNLKEFVKHFSWHPLEPMAELSARYDTTKLQRAVVMGKVRAWKARQQPDHIDPDLGVVCSRLRSKWGTISSMFSAFRATGIERRSSAGSNQSSAGNSSAHKTISLADWKAGIEACGLQLTHKQIERVYHLVERDENNGVSLHDLEEAMRLTGELARGADRTAVTRGDRWTKAPSKIKPGQESDKLRILFSNIWTSPVEAFCFFAQKPTEHALTLHEIRDGVARLGANVNSMVLMQELDALCIDGQLGWKRFLRHFSWHKRSTAGGKEDLTLYEQTKQHGMHDVYQKVETWKAQARLKDVGGDTIVYSSDASDDGSHVYHGNHTTQARASPSSVSTSVNSSTLSPHNEVQYSRRSKTDKGNASMDRIRERMGQLMGVPSIESASATQGI